MSPPPTQSLPLGVLTMPVRVVAVGASTGGPEALVTLLKSLSVALPPILITQHIAPRLALSFARYLGRHVPQDVEEARHGAELESGCVYVAPGHAHFKVAKRGDRLVVQLDGGEAVNRHRPSVDVLFDSVAAVVGGGAVGALLTGMGRDGAQGLWAMRQRGARTWVQDEASCVVFGMPRQALALGAATDVSSISRLGKALQDHCTRMSGSAAEAGTRAPA